MKLFILSMFTLFTFSSAVKNEKSLKLTENNSVEIIEARDCFQASIDAANDIYDLGFNDSVATCYANYAYAVCRGYNQATADDCITTMDRVEWIWEHYF